MRKSVTEIIETIKALKGFKKDKEVADILGISRGALSIAKQRDSLSFLTEIIEFCDENDQSLDIIRRGPIQPSEKLQITDTPGTKDGACYGNFVRVNVFSLSAGAGDKELSETEPIDSTIIPRELYNEDSLVVQMNGDSMEKLLMHGSTVVIDTQIRKILSGSLYAFKIPHAGNIVRECYSDPQGLSLIPYNKNYPTCRVMWKDFDPDMVIGKVSLNMFNVFR